MSVGAAVSNFDLMGWLKVLLFGAVLFFAWRTLRGMGLLGESENAKKERELGQGAALSKPLQQNDKFKNAVLKKFGSKPTKKQLDGLLPNKPNMPKWVADVMGARSLWGNDFEPVVAIFKQMTSQYEVNYFMQLFAIAAKKDLYTYLKKIFGSVFSSEKMATLHDIIESKPLI